MIRQAIADDVDTFIELTFLAYQPYVQLLGRRPTTMDRDCRPLIAAGSVWMESNLRGGIVLEAANEKLTIYSVVVHPDHHGRGIGLDLLRFAEDRAFACGVRALRLCTNGKMLRNLSIYERFGFAEVERETIANATSPTIVWMEKQMDQSDSNE